MLRLILSLLHGFYQAFPIVIDSRFVPKQIFKHDVRVASTTVYQHLFPYSFSRASIEALLVEELVPDGIGKYLRVEITIVAGAICHQVTNVCEPVCVFRKGNPALLVHCSPNVFRGRSLVTGWPKNGLVKVGQDDLVLHLQETKLISTLTQAFGHGVRKGLSAGIGRQQWQKVFAPCVVLHPVRGSLDKVHRGSGTRHVLKVCPAQQRVQRVSKFV